VVVISVDGLRPDAIAAFGATTMQALQQAGAWTLKARTVSPSRTLPSHVSMLTGVLPARHGILWNDDRTAEHGVVGVPTVFGRANEAGLTAAAFFSKSKLRHLQVPGTLDHTQAPRGLDTFPAARTVEDAVRYMRFRRPNLLFVHITEPDAAGHSFGWMSRAYGAAVRRSDGAVAQLIAAADATFGRGGYTVIVTADHGGSERGHGSEADADTEIPWLAWGRNVSAGPVAAPVNTVDTAASVLWLLGLDVPAELDGRVVVEAFDSAAAPVSADP
jgi:predicted AlkP superfamily pyrophosphatase or phosphodiesterase